MSNISRRDFLKTAGVMTLAVAAAGVLAGCEGNNANTPVPEANKPEVSNGKVAFTGYYGDKLTVESVGRFDLYLNRDYAECYSSQTVLKVTYTKPDVSTIGMIRGGQIYLENGTGVYTEKIDPVVTDKTGIKETDCVDTLNQVVDAAEGKTKAEKYIVVDSTEATTNGLQIEVMYYDEKGEQKIVTLPVNSTVTKLYGLVW